MARKKTREKVWYRIVSTYNYDDCARYCELTETVCMTYDRMMAKVNRYYSVGYDDYGTAEAVELEMLTNEEMKNVQD